MEVQELEVGEYNTRRCEFVANPGGPVLRILDAVYSENEDLVDTWCHTSSIAQHFGSLELRTVHRDNLDLRQLYESRYDLILAKPELISRIGQVENGASDYAMIAKYPDYGSQLVSLQGTPELSATWLQDKRFGLLDDPNSVSAYQIPKAALRRSGVADVPRYVYFRSYRQLYEALFEGKVDVIPALLSEEGPDSALQLPPGLVLEEIIPGPAWFIHRDLLQSQVHCDLLAALEQLARTAEIDFLRKLQVVQPCHAN